MKKIQGGKRTNYYKHGKAAEATPRLILFCGLIKKGLVLVRLKVKGYAKRNPPLSTDS